MKFSIIHNTYKDNPFIRESVVLNLKALEDANVDYQYIVFNDNGDECIEQYVEDLPVTYHYSDYNFGHKMCSGGWVGAIPLLEGDLVHNTGQDDIFSSYFYTNVLKRFNDTDCDLVYCNAFKVQENTVMNGEVMLPLQPIDHSQPRQLLNSLLGVKNNKVTKANNFIAAPGTVYKQSLHKEIGPPDVENFRGSCDHEYWLRVLFHEKKIEYIPIPCWLYRISQYSAGQEIIEGKHNNNEIRPYYIDQIKIKYQGLLGYES